jgi:hypothetical protein
LVEYLFLAPSGRNDKCGDPGAEGWRMIPKSGHRFPACAKPVAPVVIWLDASAGEGRSEKVMRQQEVKAR